MLSTQLARPLSRLFFGRLDARTASYRGDPGADAAVLPGRLPGDPPGRRRRSDAEHRAGPGRRRACELVLIAREERAALRIFLRALRALPAELDVARDGVVAAAARPAPATLGRALRERVEFVDAEPAHRGAGAGAAPTCSCSPPRACARSPGTLVRALAAGRDPGRLAPARVRGAPRRGRVRRRVRAGRRADARVAADAARSPSPPSAARVRAQLEPAAVDASRWSRVADELEDVYAGLVARRHDGRGDSELRARAARAAR